MRLNRYHPIPSFVIRLGHTVLLITAHEIYVNTRFHSWPNSGRSTNPGNVDCISRCILPIRQQIRMKGALRSPNAVSSEAILVSGTTQIGKFDLGFR